ncbi:MAG: heat shock protein transcriptional repressor HspR [bacterium]
MFTDDSTPLYAISVAAQLTDLHPQTLRQYDRLGLVCPQRTNGRNRLYSARDVELLREVSRLSADGVGIEGIRRILALQAEVEALRDQVQAYAREKASTSLVLWNPQRRRRA